MTWRGGGHAARPSLRFFDGAPVSGPGLPGQPSAEGTAVAVQSLSKMGSKRGAARTRKPDAAAVSHLQARRGCPSVRLMGGLPPPREMVVFNAVAWVSGG